MSYFGRIKTGGAKTTQASALAVTTYLVNAQAAAVAAPQVTIGHAFGRGDIPAGCSVLVTGPGGVVPCQQDQEAYWSDGSLKFACLALLPPDTFAANVGIPPQSNGQESMTGRTDSVAYTVSARAAPPNRAPAFTLAQFVAANDIKVVLSGFSCGSDTFAVALADVYANFCATPWDAGPIALTSAAASGATSLSLASAAQVSKGMLVTAPGVPAGTVVTSATGANPVTISNALTTAIASGAIVTFNTPLGGWEQLRGGPLCMEWRAWSYLKCISGPDSGKYHTQVRATLYVRSWGLSGPHEVEVQLENGNIHGNAPGGSVGPSAFYHSRFVCNATVQNSAKVLGYFGGPSDPRSFTVAPSAITGSKFNLSNAPTSWHGPDVSQAGCGFQITTTGTLPGGMSSSTPYWWLQGVPMLSRALNNNGWAAWAASTSYGAGAAVYTASGVYVTAGGGTSAASGGGPSGLTPAADGTITDWTPASAVVTSQGTGTHTISPTLTVFGECGPILADLQAQPLWDAGSSGVATRPNLMPRFDPTYLTTKTKMVPPLDLTITTYPRNCGKIVDRQIVGNYVDYTPGQIQPFGTPWNISQYGDDPGDDRVGLLQHSQAWLLYQQTDTFGNTLVLSCALGFSDYPYCFVNERSGLPFIGNAGPSRSPTGPQYAGLGPIDLTSTVTSGASYHPGNNVFDFCGQQDTYGPILDAAHMPNLFTVPYLRSGRRVFLDQMIKLSCSLQLAQPTNLRATVYSGSGRTFYGITTGDNSSQVRGIAWLNKIIGQAEFMMPDADVLRPAFRDILDDSAAYLDAQYGPSNTSLDVNYRALGLCNIQQYVVQSDFVAYQTIFLAASYTMNAWRDADEQRRPQWKNFLCNYLIRSILNLYDADVGGGYYFGPSNDNYYSGNISAAPGGAAGPPYFSSIKTLWADGYNGRLSFPQPAGFDSAQNVYSSTSYPFDSNNYWTFWSSTLAFASWIGMPKAATMFKRIRATINNAPYSGITWAQNSTNGHYDLNTPQSYVPWAWTPNLTL